MPDAVLLSLHADGVFVLRHRRLGYALHCHAYRLLEAGPAFQTWLRTNFEQVRRAPDDIRRDYCALIDAVRARHDTQFVVLNAISTASNENIHSYAGFDRPIGKTLGSVRAREMNLMLHDLARERNVAILDADAIAADLGTQRHAPDGIHGSGLLETETPGGTAPAVAPARRLRFRGRRGQVISKSTSSGTDASASPSGSAASSLNSASGRPTFSHSPAAHRICRSTPARAARTSTTGLVRFQFDDHRALRKRGAGGAVPFQHAQFLDVLDRSRYGQPVDHGQ